MSVVSGVTIHGGISVTEDNSRIENNTIICDRLKRVTLREVATLAWACLRGRPALVKYEVRPGIEITGHNGFVVGNLIRG